MAVKLAILKSGEQIISDVKEMEVDGKVVGYYLYKACIVRMMNPNDINPNEMSPNSRMDPPKRKGIKPNKIRSTEKTAFDITLFPWIPLAKGYEIPIVSDWIITFVDPVDMLYEMYEKNVLDVNMEWNEGMNRSSDGECKTCR